MTSVYRQAEEGDLLGLIVPRSPQSADRYCVAQRAAVSVVKEAKTRDGKNLMRPWRRTFGWPKGWYGKLFYRYDCVTDLS